jgi:hypothetical protein
MSIAHFTQNETVPDEIKGELTRLPNLLTSHGWTLRHTVFKLAMGFIPREKFATQRMYTTLWRVTFFWLLAAWLLLSPYLLLFFCFADK